MTTILHNIDDVRAEIVRLENEHIFLEADWDRVQMALIEHGRSVGLADVQRRMETARLNSIGYVGCTVAAETPASVLSVFMPDADVPV